MKNTVIKIKGMHTANLLKTLIFMSFSAQTMGGGGLDEGHVDEGRHDTVLVMSGALVTLIGTQVARR